MVQTERITFWQSSETTLDKVICVDNAVIDECASSPCLNGGTCTDVINGFRCACAASLTGIRCELGIGKFSFLNTVCHHETFSCTSTCGMFQPDQYTVDLLSFHVHFLKLEFLFLQRMLQPCSPHSSRVQQLHRQHRSWPQCVISQRTFDIQMWPYTSSGLVPL